MRGDASKCLENSKQRGVTLILCVERCYLYGSILYLSYCSSLLWVIVSGSTMSLHYADVYNKR